MKTRIQFNLIAKTHLIAEGAKIDEAVTEFTNALTESGQIAISNTCKATIVSKDWKRKGYIAYLVYKLEITCVAECDLELDILDHEYTRLCYIIERLVKGILGKGYKIIITDPHQVV